MNDQEFLRRVRRYARRNDLRFEINRRRGRGSHSLVRLGEHRSMLPRGELATGTLSAIFRQLHIDRQRF